MKKNGWFKESARHSLASKGIRTGHRPTIDLNMDYTQAEMSNLTNDNGNPWKWKKGEYLFKWTSPHKYFRIVKVSKYPESYLKVEPINESEVKI